MNLSKKLRSARNSARHLDANKQERNVTVAEVQRDRRQDEETRQEEQALDTSRRQDRRRQSALYVEHENQDRMERRSRCPKSHLEVHHVDHKHFCEASHFDSISQPSDVGRQVLANEITKHELMELSMWKGQTIDSLIEKGTKEGDDECEEEVVDNNDEDDMEGAAAAKEEERNADLLANDM